MKEIERLIDYEIKSLPSKDKSEFLDRINGHLGRLIASNYKKMKMGHKSAPYPSWMYRQTVGRRDQEIEMTQSVKPGVSYVQYFDHFGTPSIIPRRKGDEDNWGWVSNPYFLSCETLETMISEMKKYRVKFDIVGESNYFPGRSFQIRFRK